MNQKIFFSKRNSGTFLIIFLVIVFLGGAFAIYYNFENITGFFSSDKNSNSKRAETLAPTISSPIEPSITTADEPVDNERNSAINPTVVNSDSKVLGDTLTVVLYAAYDKLEPVRVTSDLNWKTNPFWIDEGQAGYFQFKDTLLVRGQYTRMLLLFNNHVIDNPRQNNFSNTHNSVIITREDLSAPKYLNQVGSGYPENVLPPDSILYYINY